MPATIPSRSYQQRLDALQKANEVRTGKSEIKAQLKARTLLPLDALNSEWGGFLKVEELLLAIPKIGRSKARKIMAEVQVSPLRKVGSLSERQRKALAAALGERVQ